MTNKIAVILCTYNPCDYLYEQIDSILLQDNVDIDIFIFDDGSNDCQSKIILESIREKVCYIYYCLPSSSAGKNFLRAISIINIKNYDYVALSDQDDIWLSNKIDIAVDKLNKNNAAGYSSNLILYDGEKEIGALKKSITQKKYDHHFQGASAGCTYVLRADFIIKIKEDLYKYDYLSHSGTLSHDWLIYFIAKTNGINWFMDDEARILYRQHNSNIYGAKRSLSKKINMLLGEWYPSNLKFINKYKNVNDDKFDINMPLYKRFFYIINAFDFRRKKIESLICYIYWVVWFRG